VGLRRLLNRRPAEVEAEDPLERLAELGAEDPEANPHPARQIAELATRDEAPPISLVGDGKKVVDVSAAESKKTPEPPRSRSGYVWMSQASRSRRAGWADFVNRTF
jgi:hypothetical protein